MEMKAYELLTRVESWSVADPGLSKEGGTMSAKGTILIFWSLKWPFPAFRDKFHTHLILIFAHKLHFCQQKKGKKSKGGAQVPQPSPSGSATVHISKTTSQDYRNIPHGLHYHSWISWKTPWILRFSGNSWKNSYFPCTPGISEKNSVLQPTGTDLQSLFLT